MEGKLTLVHKVLESCPAVLDLEVTPSLGCLYKAIAAKVLSCSLANGGENTASATALLAQVQDDPSYLGLLLNHTKHMYAKAWWQQMPGMLRKRGLHPSGIRDWFEERSRFTPTVICSLSSRCDAKILNQVIQDAKYLTYDLKACRVIVVVSSALAVAHVRTDPGRLSCMRVPDFDEQEMLDLFTNCLAVHCNSPSAMADTIAQKVGSATTRAVDVCKLGRKLCKAKSDEHISASVDSFICEKVAEAKVNLEDALLDMTMKPLVEKWADPRTLLKKILDAPGGALRITDLGISASELATRIRGFHNVRSILSIDMESRTVHFTTPAHLKAAAGVLGRKEGER